MSSSSDVAALTAAEVESFKDNGFVGPCPLCTPEDAVRRWNRAKVEMVLSKNITFDPDWVHRLNDVGGSMQIMRLIDTTHSS